MTSRAHAPPCARRRTPRGPRPRRTRRGRPKARRNPPSEPKEREARSARLPSEMPRRDEDEKWTTSAGRMMTDGHRVKSRSILCDISHKWVKSLDRKTFSTNLFHSCGRSVGRRYLRGLGVDRYLKKIHQQKMPPLGIEPKTSGLLRWMVPEEVIPDVRLGRLGNRTFVRNVCSVEVFTSGVSVTHRFLGGSVVCNQCMTVCL